MIKLKHLLLPVLIVCIFSCKSEQSKFYAIKDFRKSLQPSLFTIVSKGIVISEDSTQIKGITDDELTRLGMSENPVLRATAFREILNRSSFNYFEMVRNHLDDTAIVPIDGGEFGISFQRVSDFILQEATWETRQEKNKIIEQVLTKHNYLRSAYTILARIEPQAKYYIYIRDMATRPRRLDPYVGYELGFDEIEYALYGLARFKKKDDVQIIKNKLIKHFWELSDISFRLMKEFPDTAYLDILQTYHRSKFYKLSGNRPHGFSGYTVDKAAPEDFIQALVMQQNDRSAKLLDTMLTYLPKYPCLSDKENIINEVIMQIWEHPCPAYAEIRKKVRQQAEEILKKQHYIELDTSAIPGEKTKEIFRWYN